MDQTKKIPDPESFAKNVESAIDKLFSASRQIEIDPLTSEVKDLPQEETDQGPSSAPIEPELPEHSVLVDAVKSHIKILDDCIGYILPVEKLLARTPGMEKLLHFQENIKGRLEKQKKILEKALTGDYAPNE